MRLYLVTDEELLKGKDLYATVEAAVRGGVTMVQLREKESSTRDFVGGRGARGAERYAVSPGKASFAAR